MDELWFRLWWQSWGLAIEVAIVVPLRLQKLAAGGRRAEREAWLMVEEKVKAAQKVQALMVASGEAAGLETMVQSLDHYRRKAGANRRRLTR